MFGSGCVFSLFFTLDDKDSLSCVTFSFSDFELMVGNKVTDDNTVKVDSDRVHPLAYIKCEVSKLWKAQFSKYYSGLFPIEQQADVIVRLSGSPLDVTLCFSVAAVCLSFISALPRFIAQVSVCMSPP